MFTRQEDVIYARKYGTALTMDVFRPEGPRNGRGIVFIISGGWRSSHESIDDYAPPFILPLVRHGYTVFAAVPSSAPRFTLPEIIEDVHAAVRFVRYHATEYEVDPERLGIDGCSAGGHLALTVGFSGGPGDPNAANAVERESSRVQAIAEFYGPADFLNYGAPGQSGIGENILGNYKAPFDFHEWDDTNAKFAPVSASRRLEIAAEVSPVTHITADAPPTLVIHGDVDELVPLQQSEIVANRLEELGVPHRLIVVPGEAHGWEDTSRQVMEIVAWYDQHLLTG